MLRTSRTRVSKDPSTGSETATIASILTATPATSPPAQSTVSACAWFPRLPHAVASTRGRARTMSTSVNSSSGTITSTHAVTTARAHGFSAVARGSSR